MYLIALTGLVDIDTNSPIEALLFGSLLSSVDPVATLSIMGNSELQCDPLLYNLVFGESVLNDAIAIVLFNTFMAEYEAKQSFTLHSIITILGDFTVIIFFSVIIGVVNISYSKACLYTPHTPHIYK